MGKFLQGNDFLYLGLGAGVLYLILKNTKPLSQTVTGAASVVNPLLAAAGKGAAIVTDPESYKPYVLGLLEAPFTPEHAWRLFKLQPGFSTFTNAALTSLGLWR